MKTETDPQRVDPSTGRRWMHLCCCDTSLALCGARLVSTSPDDGTRDDTCPTCRAVEDQPCGAPQCPERVSGWLRRWFR